MHQPPTLNVHVEKPTWLTVSIVSLWLVVLSVVLITLLLGESSLLEMSLVGVFFGLLGVGIYKQIQLFYKGLLQWDGTFWSLYIQGPKDKDLQKMVRLGLDVVLDWQYLLLLRSSKKSIWIWLDVRQYTYSEWLALRRVLFYRT